MRFARADDINNVNIRHIYPAVDFKKVLPKDDNTQGNKPSRVYIHDI